MADDQNTQQPQQTEGYFTTRWDGREEYRTGKRPSDAPTLPDGVRPTVSDGAVRLDKDGVTHEGVYRADSSPASEADGVVVRTPAGYPTTLAEASADSLIFRRIGAALSSGGIVRHE